MEMIKALRGDKSLVTDILCDSFDRNRSVNDVVKQDARKRERIKALMSYSFELCYMFGDIYLSGDKNACALILYPDKKKVSLKTIWLDVKFAASCIGIGNLTRVLSRDSKIKSFYPKEPLLYLWFIGVKTEQQHRGIGTALLKNIIKESISQGRPVYLETSMKENIGFYKKIGFEVYEELDFGYPLFLIKRDFKK